MMHNPSVAVIGGGRMGSFVYSQLPAELKRSIIDVDEARAHALAERYGGCFRLDATEVDDADAILLVLPASIIPEAARAAASAAKPDALIVNMATSGHLPDGIRAEYPELTFADARIIGSARGVKEGARSVVVTDLSAGPRLELLRHILPGFTRLECGDPLLVPLVNAVGSTEGIRAAVACRKQLAQYRIPKEWKDAVIYTVCTGTMRAHVDGDLGGFAKALAEKLEAE